MTKRSTIPEFTSVREEMEYWDTHEPSEIRAAAAGLPAPSVERERTEPVTIRFDEELIEKLRRLAAEAGMPYQTLLRALIKRELFKLEEADRIADEQKRRAGARTKGERKR